MLATDASRIRYTPKCFKKQDLERPGPTSISHVVVRLKNIAFTSNQRAKQTIGEERAAHYRRKHEAINTLLRMGSAFVNEDELDWHRDDPVIGLLFEGGGGLHIIVSALDSDGLRAVRRQLNG